MKPYIAVLLLPVFTAALVAVGIAQAPTPTSDPQATRVQTLERELAGAKADLLSRDIALSTCRATVAQAQASYDSYVLSDRANRLVEDFKKAFGGEWAWSTAENRPVRPAKP